VSYDRPYARSGASTLLRDEAPFVRYVESRGFDVTYATDVDLHATPSIASGQRAVSPIGHSEYWTMPMYDTARAARDAGVSITSFGANNIYWHIRMESSGAGVPNRVIVSYRTSAADPVADPALETVQFRQLGKPEQLILGEMFASPNGLVPKNHPWVVSAAGSWFYRGTGLANGQSIRGIVGGETDYRQMGYAFPASTASYVLAHSPVVNQYGGSGVSEATLYRSPSSAWVFDAGSLRYTWGLEAAGYVDARAQAMTTNLLARTSGFASSVTTQRLAGADRYATAAAISAETFAPDVPVAYVATGSDFPDALAATAATLGQGPVLPVWRDDIPQVIEAELVRLRPASVVVVGSPAVVSDAVVSRIASLTGVTPTRQSGADRFATAAAVSAARFSPGVPTLYIATGMNFPDALAAGAAGAQVGGPVLLSASTGLTTPTLNEIKRLQPRRIVIVGSTGVVPGFLDSYLASTAPVVRLAGTDRYATSQAVGRDLHSAGSAPFVAVATGTNYPDALAGGAAVAHQGGGLVIAPTSLTPSVAEEIVRSGPERVAFLGSEAVVSAGVATAVRRLFDVVDGVPVPAVVDRPVEMAPQVRSDGLDEPVFRDDTTTELPWLDR
jgi:putative cell wall-binding protein